MNKNKIFGYIFLVLSIATNVFIIYEAAVPAGASGAQSMGLSAFIAQILNTLFHTNIDYQDPTYLHVMRKLIGHFSLFGVSGLFTTLSLIFFLKEKKFNSWLTLLFSLIIGLIIAISSEVVQLYTDGRSGQFSDVMIDFSGYLLFSFIVFIIFYAISKKKATR